MANDESDAAVERLLPSQRVEAAEGEDVALGVEGEGTADEAGGFEQNNTTVNIRQSNSFLPRSGAPRRPWFSGRRGNKGAATAGGKTSGVTASGANGEAAPSRTVAGGASKDDARDRLLDSDDVCFYA